jgi:hypothetical protein
MSNDIDTNEVIQYLKRKLPKPDDYKAGVLREAYHTPELVQEYKSGSVPVNVPVYYRHWVKVHQTDGFVWRLAEEDLPRLERMIEEYKDYFIECLNNQ